VRLFVALDITDDIRSRIQRFIEGVSGFAPDARWVSPESLHLTLKFIGEKPEASVENIKQALSTVKSESLEIVFRGHGFFPGPKRARIFWIGVEAGTELAAVASAVDQALVPLGVAKEIHSFSPHITLARVTSSEKHYKGGGLDRGFDFLQKKLAVFSIPEFGSMTAREFFLYESRPSSSGGPQYVKLSGFGLS
jgi:RNA 2',3'-cyclic 3'-phosphodiesterase